MQAHWIQNFDALATDTARTDALHILEAGFDCISTERIIGRQVSVSDDAIVVRGQTFDIRPFKSIYLVGFGKGSCTAVYEMYKILNTRLKKTVVIDRSVLTTCPVEIEAFAGTHPLPSEANVQATKVITAVAEGAGADDLVLVVVAGGGSSLLIASEEELEQNMRLFKAAERVGATIAEINLVRKHISSLKGGGLAKMLYPSTVLGLVFSDIVGGHPEEVASGPTYFDTTTIADAKTVLDKHGLGNDFKLQDTPKDTKYFEKVTNIVLISNEDAIHAMAESAMTMGYTSVVVPEPVYTEPAETLKNMFSRAAPGSVVFAGGEVRYSVPEDHGKGGRCQYLALEALNVLRPHDVFVAAASDGRDNSDKAGAIVDEGTIRRVEEKKIDLEACRRRLDTVALFEQTGDEIVTGPTEANVSDWYFLLTPR